MGEEVQKSESAKNFFEGFFKIISFLRI